MKCAWKVATFSFVLVLTMTSLPALEVDVGAGITVDVAPYGIEYYEPMVVVAPWIGPRDLAQAGLLVTGSLSPGKADVSAAACVRLWPVPDRVAVYAGAGALADPNMDPVFMPFLVGGLRLELGNLAFLVPGLAMRIEPGNTDSEAWLVALWKL